MDRDDAVSVRNAKLFALLSTVGLMVVGVHDYAYRRGDVGGTGDYELGGLITHAGTDMVVLTVIISAAAVLWANRTGSR